MKRCLHCRAELPDTAIRCRRCRRAVIPPPGGDDLFRAASRARSLWRGWNHRWRETADPCWGVFEVLVVTLGAIAAAWIFGQEQTGIGLVDWCRQQWDVVRQEPRLQAYLFVFTQTFALKCLIVAAIFLSLRSRGCRRPWENLGFRPGARPLPWGLAPAYFVFAVVVAYRGDLDPLIGHLPTPLFFEAPAALGNGLSVLSWVVVAPLAEEIFFRGYAYPAFARKWGAIPSLAVTTALFALAHAPQLDWDPSRLVWLLAGGLFLTAARMISGSTAPAVWMHATYNATLAAWGFLKYGVLGY